MTVLVFPENQQASLFIVNWWYATVDSSYIGDAAVGKSRAIYLPIMDVKTVCIIIIISLLMSPL
jgi:hypothetical protein